MIKLESEYRFHPTRRWRFDYANTEHKIAIEIEGGVFTGGRHTRGKGFVNDMEKYNEAVKLGWKILRYTPQQFRAFLHYRDIDFILKSNLKSF